jgi:hypothetical protein
MQGYFREINIKIIFCLFISAILGFLQSCSCNKEKPLTQEELINNFVKWNIEEARNSGQSAEKIAEINVLNFIKDKVILPIIPCLNYGDISGLKGCFKIKARLVDFMAIEMENREEAIKLAKKIKGYHLKNWVLDDVLGEPVLEDLAENVFKAKRFDQIEGH